ncbi:CDC42 small effector protein homolog isoform X2 [Cloeon dipterum]
MDKIRLRLLAWRTKERANGVTMSLRSRGVGSGDLWLQWFSCCVTQHQRPPPRRRIDRSMIGNPTNFQHTGHIGSGDISRDTGRLNALQSQMQSKGGYEMAVKAC